MDGSTMMSPSHPQDEGDPKGVDGSTMMSPSCLQDEEATKKGMDGSTIMSPSCLQDEEATKKGMDGSTMMSPSCLQDEEATKKGMDGSTMMFPSCLQDGRATGVMNRSTTVAPFPLYFYYCNYFLYYNILPGIPHSMAITVPIRCASLRVCTSPFHCQPNDFAVLLSFVSDAPDRSILNV
ncbi:hypothetical protein [Pasteuria penetrans]|uniref:hypothetical protein n=1 Tax=Pasteuria penetrans TaxID=86005 RepID=UPI001CAA6494|nr:hypothetical protein [Pasteuria penetrans]